MKALDRLFAIEDPPGQAPEPAGLAFRWYSVTEGRAGDGPWRHSVFYDRVDLFPYFATRRKQNERWELISVNIGIASSSRPGAVGIGYTIRRSADDLPSSLAEYAQGKGEIDCPAQRIFVWSMGQDERDRVPAGEVVASCPVPAGWTPGSAILACSRSSESGERAGPNARALTPDFKLNAASTRLPSQCNAQRASKRLRLALAAFNAGRGASFSGHLAPRGRLHAYPPTERPLIGRTAIAGFVAARYAEGDGWTGTALRAPRRARNRGLRGRPQTRRRLPPEPVALEPRPCALRVECQRHVRLSFRTHPPSGRARTSRRPSAPLLRSPRWSLRSFRRRSRLGSFAAARSRLSSWWSSTSTESSSSTPTLNSFVTVRSEEALDDARAADARAEDAPFRGVPIAIKDLTATAGIRTTYSCRAFADYVPDFDTAVVRRIREAGFVIVGKTNTPEFGTTAFTESELNGATRNPWSPELTPGGSSGGAAAAVAAGLVPLAHGSDGGGSIRIPASCCGVFGIKPARGRVSSAPFSSLEGLSTSGPISRYVSDAAAFLDVLSGYEPGDPWWAPPPERPFTEEAALRPGKLRVAVTDVPPIDVPVRPECSEGLVSAAALLQELGHEVVEATPPWSGSSLIDHFIAVWQVSPALFAGRPGASNASQPRSCRVRTLARRPWTMQKPSSSSRQRRGASSPSGATSTSS